MGSGYNMGLDTTHALLWNGTANSAVDLQPTNLDGFSFSGATAIHGTQEVSSAGILSNAIYHAMLWNGTADSAIDLHPTNLDGFESSFALGTDGVHQVGTGYTGLIFHALLWSGTADSSVDLHPTQINGIISSEVYGISGNQQVGAGDDGVEGDFSHALLWNGTADSAVDLHPTNLDGFVDSYAYGTNGTHQIRLGVTTIGPWYTPCYGAARQTPRSTSTHCCPPDSPPRTLGQSTPKTTSSAPRRMPRADSTRWNGCRYLSHPRSCSY